MLGVTKRRIPAMRWWMWGLSVLFVGTVLGVIALPAWVEQPWRQVIMMGLDPFCHQILERSPHIDGIQLAVCHRCFGVYAGLFLGPWVMLLTRRWESDLPLLLLGMSLAPAALDWTLDVVGLMENTPVSRILTGSLFGALAGALVVRGIAEHQADSPRDLHKDAPRDGPPVIQSRGIT
ncbi:MAG: DUF2085 domain-containing protein [Bacteroidota bacterium]|nr:DUF2085 domain-containing protein [Bacteroidota bacterium]